MREADANETSGELGSAFGRALVAVSQLRIIPLSDPLIESAILLPLVSVDLKYQDGCCVFNSPMISVSCVGRKCSIEDLYPLLQELFGGI